MHANSLASARSPAVRVIAALVASFGIGVAALSQKALPPGPGTNVKLQRAAAPPDGKTSAQLTLAPVAGIKVGQLDLTLSYPKALLTYVSYETSGLTDAAEADVQAAVKPNEKDATLSTLSLSISTLRGKATKRPLPSGTLLYVIFQVAKTAKLNDNISIDMTGTAVTLDEPPQPVTPLTVQAAKLLVSNAPITSCFFYMH